MSERISKIINIDELPNYIEDNWTFVTSYTDSVYNSFDTNTYCVKAIVYKDIRT